MQYIKTQNTVDMQLTLSRLPIPEVIIDIIKDYIYHPKISALQKKHTRKIVDYINSVDVNSRKIYNSHGVVRGIEWCFDKLHSHQFRSIFCSCCGEYDFSHQNNEFFCFTQGNTEDLYYDYELELVHGLNVSNDSDDVFPNLIQNSFCYSESDDSLINDEERDIYE